MNRLWIAAVPLAALAWHAVNAGESHTAAAAGQTFDVRQSMIDTFNPAALALWDVGNNAMSEDGSFGLDPAFMTEDGWTKIEEGAYRLGEESHRMASATRYVATGPNLVDGEVPEGVSTREEIQAAIDADPEDFRALSQSMADMAVQIYNAAQARDAEAAGEVIFMLDTVCQSCHVKYWYPPE
ncbi:MAG TPA: cytochrome c [Alteraurantiacibacter sp.]